jgi:hypothetical protein
MGYYRTAKSLELVNVNQDFYPPPTFPTCPNLQVQRCKGSFFQLEFRIVFMLIPGDSQCLSIPLIFFPIIGGVFFPSWFPRVPPLSQI